MPRRFTLIKAFALAVAAIYASTASHADLTPADAAQVETLRGTPVLSSDGRLLGVMEGAAVNGDSVSLFLKPNSSKIVTRFNKEIVVRTKVTGLSLQGTQIILEASAQKLRSKASVFEPDDDIVRIYLSGR
ncbi:MAG: hypothetical protein AB3N17_19505 [Tateyamaria sp.]